MRVCPHAYLIFIWHFLAAQCTHQSPVKDVHTSIQHLAECSALVWWATPFGFDWSISSVLVCFLAHLVVRQKHEISLVDFVQDTNIKSSASWCAVERKWICQMACLISDAQITSSETLAASETSRKRSMESMAKNPAIRWRCLTSSTSSPSSSSTSAGSLNAWKPLQDVQVKVDFNAAVPWTPS